MGPQKGSRPILAIETSCDDTSVALVHVDGNVDAVLSASQDLEHEPFGGIVPELASRNHTLQLLPLIEKIFVATGTGWNSLEGIAVTNRPGLIGSLMVGVVTAKTLSLVHSLPLVGVNHIEGHLLAPFLKDSQFQAPEGFGFPYVALAVSGGHTHLFLVEGIERYRVLGKTVDDAAGEAFDKFAKWIGLGYPGGALVDRASQDGRIDAFHFPRALMKEGNIDFSFSGLKTASAKILADLGDAEVLHRRGDLCASFQEAVVDVLIEKLKRAGEMTDVRTVVVTGGVSANSRLRQRLSALAQEKNWIGVVPPLRYCTDNAAMIGYVGIQKLLLGHKDDQSLSPSASAYASDYQVES